MSSTSTGGGQASDARAETLDHQPGRSATQQRYLDNVAAEAEKAVGVVEDMVADLERSLADRRDEARRAREEADNGRVDTSDAAADSEGGA